MTEQQTSQSLLLKWKESKAEIRVIDIIRLAAKENNTTIVNELVDLHKDLCFTKEVTFILAKAGRDITFIAEKKILDNRDLAYYAAITGNRSLVEELIIEGEVDLILIAYGAAQGGHSELVYSMIDLGVTNYDIIGKGAAEYGDIGMIDDMIARGARNLNWFAEYAAKGGHDEIVYEMIRRGANEWNFIACRALTNGNMELFNEMVEKGANPSVVAAHAAQCGYNEIVKDMINRGAKNYDDIAESAAYGGHISIIEQMISYGVTSFDVEPEEDDIYILRAVRINPIAGHGAKGGRKHVLEHMINIGHQIDTTKLDFGYHVDCR